MNNVFNLSFFANFANPLTLRFALFALKAFPPLADANDAKFPQKIQSEDI
ncbi:MAG: hypothetical protein FD122_1535 [Stygiobacter sp.]|nr:MAG: hypothetical protein FD122_1535 [Stygiobacter sp.]KAF0214393.1 MAG: hypothetical protein FD178_2469 [Ignavibacteria bacterium]